MKRFALVDCNNFFVSCERVFNPKLINKPVAVLSSNDACVIARSNEVKKLGIKMGEPYFACKDLLKKNNAFVYSSNFSLYGDMSARVMQTLTDYSTDIEEYSVDEAFLYFPDPFINFDGEQSETDYYNRYAKFVRKKVKQKTGIPVSIGMGPTKTLAKIANHIAKKNPEYAGVFDITNHKNLDHILKNFEISDIWGIGYRYTKKLNSYGIKNAYELRQCDENWVRKHLTITGLKTVLELRGISCLNLQDIVEPKQSITVSRSFGKNVTNINELKEAASYHVSTAAEKLRNQNAITGSLTIFICYTHFYEPQRYYDSTTIQLPIATSYTPDLIKFAHQCLEKLTKRIVVYKKIGVILSDFNSSTQAQFNIFHQMPDLDKQSKIMQTIDHANSKLGKNKIFYAAVGNEHSWATKKSCKSPNYTTSWNEILTIKI